jgi:3-hydroxybutyryl-CoA dehydrogenase
VPDALTPAEGAASEGARAVSRVGVVGSGTMASGIAEVFIKAGFATVQVARTDEKVTAARAAIARSLARAVEKGKLSGDERDAALAGLVSATRLTDVADCDLIIEAVVEDLDVKIGLFKELDEIAKPGAVLATTTSSLPVIECAMATSRPRDVVGLHFFNPAPVMKLVEVVRTVATADDVLATAHAVAEKIGKHAVDCGDRAGFIVNALLFPYLNDAVKMLQAHYATADGIDTAMKLGCGYPMGPFELLDVVGLDVALAIERTLYLEFREPGFAPAPLLEHLVTAGYLGRKTGKGFRDYAR